LVHLQCSQRIPQKFISYFPCRDTSKYNVKKIDRLAALAYTGFLDFQHLVRKLHFGNLAFSSHSGMARMGLYIKYTTLFWTNFDPLPLSHIVGPPKVRHTSRTPQFLVVHAYIHMSLQRVCLSSRGLLFGNFVLGFLSGRFCAG